MESLLSIAEALLGLKGTVHGRHRLLGYANFYSTCAYVSAYKIYYEFLVEFFHFLELLILDASYIILISP